MKSHYEVLEVAVDADCATIKTAYRKLALRWHPDKNLNDLENAKSKFIFIKKAYDVLSDSKKRYCYDRHCEQISRAKQENSKKFQHSKANGYKRFDNNAGEADDYFTDDYFLDDYDVLNLDDDGDNDEIDLNDLFGDDGDNHDDVHDFWFGDDDYFP